MRIRNTDNIIKKVKLKNGSELILRRPMIEDASEIIEYLNIVGGESDNLLFGAGEFKLSIDQEKDHIENINNDDNSLMLLGVIDNKIISVAHIGAHNRKRIVHNSEIAISVIKEYWGVGVGSAVMEQLIKFAKDNIFIENISLGVRATNDTAIKLYKKYGFEKIGVHKNFFNINGKYYDEILMDLYLK